RGSFGFFFSSRRRHTRFSRDWSSDVCSSDLAERLRVVTTEVCHQESAEVCSDILPDRSYSADELGTRRRLRALPAVTWDPFRSEIGRASCRERAETCYDVPLIITLISKYAYI